MECSYIITKYYNTYRPICISINFIWYAPNNGYFKTYNTIYNTTLVYKDTVTLYMCYSRFIEYHRNSAWMAMGLRSVFDESTIITINTYRPTIN